MKRTIQVIVKARDQAALAAYLRDHFGLAVSEAHLGAIIEQAGHAGGSDASPWSDATWRLWLKAKATQAPQTAARLDSSPDDGPAGAKELEAALLGASNAVFSTPPFEFCQLRGADRVRADYPDNLWEQLFPTCEAKGKSLREQFEAHGGGRLLGKAPLASWLYARLLFLGLPGVEEENDLGGYWVRLVVKSVGRPLGFLSLEGAADGVDVELEGRTPGACREMWDRFLGLLMSDIKELTRCEIHVRGAEVDWTNSYGWTGYEFLGAANVAG
jgi:hypothetical protein